MPTLKYLNRSLARNECVFCIKHCADQSNTRREPETTHCVCNQHTYRVPRTGILYLSRTIFRYLQVRPGLHTIIQQPHVVAASHHIACSVTLTSKREAAICRSGWHFVNTLHDPPHRSTRSKLKMRSSMTDRS